MPKEKKLFQMAVSSRNNSGFTLVEILLYISFYGLVMALLIPCAEGIIKVDNRLEMEGFCQRLAAEVTALQQAALWGAGLQNKLTVDLDQQCYYVYREGKIVKKVRLQEIGQGSLYFYSPNTSIIRFSAEGAPQVYFSVLIKNSRIICSPRREKRIPETPQSRINTMFLRLCSFLWLRYKNLF